MKIRDQDLSATPSWFWPRPPLDAQLSSSFFGLFPAEVRLLIYEFAFAGEGVHLKQCDGPAASGDDGEEGNASGTMLCFPCYKIASAKTGYVAFCEPECHRTWMSEYGKRLAGAFNMLWSCKLMYTEVLPIIQKRSFVCFATTPEPWSTPSIPSQIPTSFQNLAVHWRIGGNWWRWDEGDFFALIHRDQPKQTLSHGRHLKTLRLTIDMDHKVSYLSTTASQERFLTWLAPVLEMEELKEVVVCGWWSLKRIFGSRRTEEGTMRKLRLCQESRCSPHDWVYGWHYEEYEEYVEDCWFSHQEFYGADDDSEISSSNSDEFSGSESEDRDGEEGDSG